MTMEIDNITLAVIVKKLEWATEEMNTYLTKSAYSSNIKIRKDCSCALYTKNGEMLAQGTFIPVHLGILSQTLKELLKVYPIDTIKEGDVLLHNDPYMMGSHLNDVMVFKPIFYQGQLLAFTGCLAHHVDIGGSKARYTSSTIFEEGLRIAGAKIMKEGVLQEDILRIITTNVRTSYEVKGDLMAQLAACYRGEERVIELAKKYGIEPLMAYFEEILNYSETGIRNAIRKLPNGETSFEDYIEHDGINQKLIKIKVNVIIKDEDIYVDFDGSAEPGEGGYNSPWSLTHSAVYYAIKSVIGTSVPTNSGAYRAIHLIRPTYDSIVDAKFPHAVDGCTNSPSQRIVDVVIGAFSRIIPEKTCACDGHWPAAHYGGLDPKTGRFFAYIETYACGRGAKYNDDGANAHQTHMTNTANAHVEMIELEYPLLVEKYSLVNDSGGAGKFRGGLGITREIKCLTDTYISTFPSRPTIKPYGLYGGEGGQTDTSKVKYPDGTESPAFAKQIEKGSVVVIQTSGGGGWGNPKERDKKKLEWDVLNEYVSLKAAKEKYGIEIDPIVLKQKYGVDIGYKKRVIK